MKRIQPPLQIFDESRKCFSLSSVILTILLLLSHFLQLAVIIYGLFFRVPLSISRQVITSLHESLEHWIIGKCKRYSIRYNARTTENCIGDGKTRKEFSNNLTQKNKACHYDEECIYPILLLYRPLHHLRPYSQVPFYRKRQLLELY